LEPGLHPLEDVSGAARNCPGPDAAAKFRARFLSQAAQELRNPDGSMRGRTTLPASLPSLQNFQRGDRVVVPWRNIIMSKGAAPSFLERQAGRVRSQGWIWLFSSMHSTRLFSGGLNRGHRHPSVLSRNLSVPRQFEKVPEAAADGGTEVMGRARDDGWARADFIAPDPSSGNQWWRFGLGCKVALQNGGHPTLVVFRLRPRPA